MEFALSLPVLVALVSAVADYGWYLSRQAEVIECVRDAARAGIAAAADQDPEALAETRVRESLAVVGLDPAAATVDAATEVDATLGEDVLVLTVTVPYLAPVGLVPTPALLGARISMLVPS